MIRRLTQLTVITTGCSESLQYSQHTARNNMISHQKSDDGAGQVLRRSFLSQVVHVFRVLSGRSTIDHPYPKHLPRECPVCGGVVFPDHNNNR